MSLPNEKRRSPDRRRNPWNSPRPNAKFDLIQAERFETVQQAKKEAGIRVAMLRKRLRLATTLPDNRPYRQAIRRLANCKGRKKPCTSMACPRCMRQQRRVFVGQVLEFAEREGYYKVAFTTLLAGRWKKADTRLEDLNPASMMVSLRYQLDQAGFKGKLPIVGAVDVEYRKGWFNAHFHLFILYRNEKLLSRCEKVLRKRFYNKHRHEGIERPMEIKRRDISDLDPDNTLLLIGYGLKGAWFRVEAEAGRKGRYRIPEPYFSRHLCWLDDRKLYELRFLYGVNARGGRLERSF